MKIQFLIVILILAIFFIITIDYAEAGTNIIEFKKKYVTNSPKVCGDKLCDEASSDKSYKKKNNQTQLGQFKNGIPIHKITCKSNYIFVQIFPNMFLSNYWSYGFFICCVNSIIRL